jgi:hypothetical protein
MRRCDVACRVTCSSQEHKHHKSLDALHSTLHNGLRAVQEKLATGSTLPSSSSSGGMQSPGSKELSSASAFSVLSHVSRDVMELKNGAARERDKLNSALSLAQTTIEEKNKALTVWRSKYAEVAAKYVCAVVWRGRGRDG